MGGPGVGSIPTRPNDDVIGGGGRTDPGLHGPCIIRAGLPRLLRWTLHVPPVHRNPLACVGGERAEKTGRDAPCGICAWSSGRAAGAAAAWSHRVFLRFAILYPIGMHTANGLVTPDSIAAAVDADGTGRRGCFVATQRGERCPPPAGSLLIPLLWLLERPLPLWRSRACVAQSNEVLVRTWSAKRRHVRRGCVETRTSPVGPHL